MKMQRPSKLYVYLSPARLDVLRHAHLHFTAISQWSDPYLDNAPMVAQQAVQVTQAQYQATLKKQFDALPPSLKGLMTWESFQQQAEKKREAIEADIRQRLKPTPVEFPDPSGYIGLGGARLFAKADNPLLWERYADRHRGVVLEFHQSMLVPSGAKHLLRPVIYCQERPQRRHPIQPFPALFHRPTVYASEEEWRLIRPMSDAKALKTLKNGDEVGFFSFSPKALSSVIFGALCPPETREQVTRILQYNLLYKPGRTLREVRLDPVSYRLHLRGTL